MSAITAQELEAQMPDTSQLLSDEPEMESSLHYMQLLLLVTCLEFAWQDRNDFFIGANLTIYFSRQQLKNHDFRGPDFFLVKNTARKPRKSWVVWEEDGRYPDLIIELLSDSTADTDRYLKRDLYAERFHTPEYFYFSPDTLEFAGFRLDGDKYQPIVPNDQGWLWSKVLGFFLGIEGQELRYFTLEGAVVPTPQEAVRIEVDKGMAMVEQERLKAIQAEQDAEQERLRAIQAQQDVEQERLKAIQAQQDVEQERLKAIQAQQDAEQERLKAIQAQQDAEQERLKAIQAQQDAEQAKAELQELQNQVRSLGIFID